MLPTFFFLLWIVDTYRLSFKVKTRVVGYLRILHERNMHIMHSISFIYRKYCIYLFELYFFNTLFAINNINKHNNKINTLSKFNKYRIFTHSPQNSINYFHLPIFHWTAPTHKNQRKKNYVSKVAAAAPEVRERERLLRELLSCRNPRGSLREWKSLSRPIGFCAIERQRQRADAFAFSFFFFFQPRESRIAEALSLECAWRKRGLGDAIRLCVLRLGMSAAGSLIFWTRCADKRESWWCSRKRAW